MTVYTRIAIVVAIVAAVYVVIALGLTLFAPTVREGKSLNFDRLKVGSRAEADDEPLLSFTARDGEKLSYRHIRANGDTAVVILHGSGYHGAYLVPIASYLSERNQVDVYLPNLRGHIGSGDRRGDIDYVGQLEDDLSDLIELIKRDNPDAKVLIGGHSSGGAMAIRFAASQYGGMAENYFMLAPVLGHKAPTFRKDSGGWAQISLPRIIGLSMLGNVGVHWLDGLETIQFNMPENVRNGTETLAYSYRLMTNFNLHPDFESDLRMLPDGSLTLVGSDDEAMLPESFPQLFKKLERHVEVLNHHDHFSLVQSESVFDRLGNWIDDPGITPPR